MQAKTSLVLQMQFSYCHIRAIHFFFFVLLFLPLSAIAQAPPNDEPCDAAQLSNVLTNYTHTTQDATADWYINDCANLEHKASVWYKFHLSNGNNGVRLLFNGIGSAPNTVAIGQFTGDCDNSVYTANAFYCDVTDADEIELFGLSNDEDYYVLIASAPESVLNYSIVYNEFKVNCNYADTCPQSISISTPANSTLSLVGCNIGNTPYVQNNSGIPLVSCFDFSNRSVSWYVFYPDYSTNFLDLNVISADLEEIQVGVFTGECGELIPLRCHVGFGNEVEISSIEIDQYGFPVYIAISGTAANDTGEFNLTISAVGPNGNHCQQNGNITIQSTSMGSPLTGPFYPGEQVQVCLDFDWPGQQQNQWFHGLVPYFGPGWESNFWDPYWEPTLVTPWYIEDYGYQMEWYSEPVVYYNNNNSDTYQLGQPVEPGWFVTGWQGTNSPSIQFCSGAGPAVDPNCSYGVNPNIMQHYNICFELVVSENLACEDVPEWNDLTISFRTFGDGETGGFSTASNPFGCGYDAETVENFTMHCCDPVETVSQSQFLPCPFDQLYFDLNDLISNPSDEYSFEWTVSSSNDLVNIPPSLQDCSENCNSILNDYVDNNQFLYPVTLLFTVQIFNSEGCNVGNSKLTVFIPAGQENHIIGPEYLCVGECATYQVIGEVIYNGEIINDQFEFCAEEPGSYTIEHYANICPVFNFSTITVYESQEVEISTGNNNSSFCDGQGSIELIASTNIWPGYHVQYSWKPPGASDFELTLDPVYFATEPGIYQVLARSAFGNCESIAEIELLDGGPTLFLSTGYPNNEVCTNDLPIEILAEATNGASGSFIYDWLLPDGSIFAGNVHTTDSPGIYTVVATDANGCSALESIEITTVNPIEIDFLIPSQVCVSTEEQDILAALPESGIFSGDGVVNGNFWGDTPGNYTVNYQTTDINGCNTEGNYVIEVLEVVQGFVEHPSQVCESEELIPLIANPPGGSYSNSPIIEGNNIWPTIPGVYDITYTYGDPTSDCSGEYTFSITVNEAPIVSLTTNQTEFCQSNNASEALTFSPAGGTFTQGNLDVNNNFIPSQLGENIIEYTYTDPNTGCSAVATTSILVNANSTVSMQTPGLLCAGSTGQAFGFPEGGEFDGPGISNDGIFSAQASGSFEITYSYENSAGCVSETSATIEVVDLPALTVDAPSSICQGNSALNLFTATPDGGIYSGDQVTAQGLFTPAALGVNEIDYSYVDPTTGCSATYSFTILVEENSDPQFIMPPTSVCLYSSATIQLNAEPSGGTFSGGLVSSDGVFTPNQVGTFSVTYTLGAGNLCPGETTIDIEVLDLPFVGIDGPTMLCLGGPAEELAPGPSGGQYISGNMNAQGEFMPTIVGLNTVVYEYTNAAGCSATVEWNILVSEAEPAVISGPTTVCLDPLNNNAVSYMATPPGGTWSNNVGPDGLFVPNELGISAIGYLALDQNGCESFAELEIEVLAVPTITLTAPEVICLSQLPQTTVMASPAGGMFFGSVDAQGNLVNGGLGSYEVGYLYTDPNTGCMASKAMTIEVIPDVNASVAHPDIACFGNEALDVLVPFPVGGTFDGPVDMNGNFEPFQVGINTITYHYTDPLTGCSDSHSFTIEVINEELLSEPLLQTYISGDLCIGAIHQFCIYPVPNAQDYIWTTNNGIVQYATADHLCVNVGWNAPGSDQLCITPIGNCGPSANVLCVDVNLVFDPGCIIFNKLADLQKHEVDIYPNPSTGILHFTANHDLDNITVYNAIGEVMLVEKHINSLNHRVDLSRHSEGVYFIKIGNQAIRKIVLTR